MKKYLLVLSLIGLLSCGVPASSSSSTQTESESSSSSFQSASSSSSEESISSNEYSSESSSSASSAFYSYSSVEEPSLGFGEPQKPASQDLLSLFDLASDIKISINLSKEAASFMSAYQSSRNDSTYHSVYVPCDLTLSLNGQTYEYEEVGIRVKGNTSRTKFYEKGEFTHPVHFKLSFKATFDGAEYNYNLTKQFKKEWTAEAKNQRKNRNLFGLEKLDLKYIPRNGKNSDFLEPYAYSLFRQAGLMAPYAGVGKATLTCEDATFESDYELVETIDKEFLKRRMDKAHSSGDLYKCVYGMMGKADLARQDAVVKETDAEGYNVGERDSDGRKIGVEDDYNLYHPSYDLKTNDDGEDSDFSKMSEYINTMWNCTYAGAPSSRLEEKLDIDHFLRFSAATYLLGNFDDQRYNANNYYLYFMPTNKKAYYIPYDWDWCLGVDGGRGFARRKIFDNKDIDGWNEISNNAYLATIIDGSNTHVSYSKENYKKQYRAQIDSLVDDGFLEYGRFESFVERSSIECVAKDEVRNYLETKAKTVAEDSSYRS